MEWVSKLLFDLRLYCAREKPPSRKIVDHALIICSPPVYAVLVAVYPLLLLKRERTELVLEYTGSRDRKAEVPTLYRKAETNLLYVERNAPKRCLINS